MMKKYLLCMGITIFLGMNMQAADLQSEEESNPQKIILKKDFSLKAQELAQIIKDIRSGKTINSNLEATIKPLLELLGWYFDFGCLRTDFAEKLKNKTLLIEVLLALAPPRQREALLGHSQSSVSLPHKIAEYGDAKTLELLLNQGVNPNGHLYFLLHSAVKSGDYDTVKLLLDRGVCRSTQHEFTENKSPLDIAKEQLTAFIQVNDKQKIEAFTNIIDLLLNYKSMQSIAQRD